MFQVVGAGLLGGVAPVCAADCELNAEPKLGKVVAICAVLSFVTCCLEVKRYSPSDH